jgi:hypothetical protein
VKTDLNPYGTPLNLANSQPLKNGKALPVGARVPDALKPASAAKDYKVDLSEAARQPATSSPSLPSAPSAPSLPSTPDLPSLPKEAVQEVAKDKVKEKATEKAEKLAKAEESIKAGSVKKPAIIFVSGLQWMYSPSKSEGSYAGVGRMAEAVDGSRIYGWDQKDDIIEQIKKTHSDFPVILVGHSLGGDTVKEVADELDSLEHSFRKVDLLVTIDAVGFGNDIIPQNVKEHLNVFGENDMFLNDGPHVARRFEKTQVQNILSPLDHTELDDSKEIQFEIMEAINKVLPGRTKRAD